MSEEEELAAWQRDYSARQKALAVRVPANWKAIYQRIESGPNCGVDFCDECGDCLHCYGGDPCTNGGEHVWLRAESMGSAPRPTDEP